MTKHLLVCSIFFILCHSIAWSQTIAITSSTIGIENSTTNSFDVPCLLSVAPSVKVRANSSALTDASTGKTIPLSKIRIFINSIGGTVNLGTNNTEIILSQADQTLYSALAVVNLGGSTVNFRYRIIQSDMTSSAWEAGSYSVDLTYTTPGGVLCLGTATTTVHLTVTVDAFMNLSSPSAVTLLASAFTNFRTTSPSASNSLTVKATVPFNLKVNGNTTNFAYTPIAANASLTPTTPISKVLIQPQALTGSINVNPTTTYQALSGSISVPVGNSTTINLLHTIAYTDIATYFTAAGDYTVLATYQVNDARTSPTLTAQTASYNIKETTSDLQELLVNNSTVSLTFNNVTDYKNGISVDMPSHVSVSKTTPMDVYVKASGSTLLQGANSIPASVITIQGTASQTGITPVQLSATAQKIYSSALPIVNSSLSIQYAISAANTPQVLSKPAGTYTTTITYSFTAP